jgi:hypothetical protein
MQREKLTLVLYPSFHAGFTCSPIGVPAHQFEVFGNVVHFLSFEIGDDDEYLIAARIVHAPK